MERYLLEGSQQVAFHLIDFSVIDNPVVMLPMAMGAFNAIVMLETRKLKAGLLTTENYC